MMGVVVLVCARGDCFWSRSVDCFVVCCWLIVVMHRHDGWCGAFVGVWRSGVVFFCWVCVIAFRCWLSVVIDRT